MNTPFQLQKTNTTNTIDQLQLSPITLNEDYRKKWNVSSNDFMCLTRGGELLRPTLYRIGGLWNVTGLKEQQINERLNQDKYIILLKHTEAYYDKDIIKITKADPKYLSSSWVIINNKGEEKVQFKSFDSPYLVNDSCIYQIKSDFYNIETGEYYGHAHKYMESSEYLFIDKKYDTDKTKRGVMRINKIDGTHKLFT